MSKTVVFDIDITALLKSFELLSRFFKEAKTDLEKAGVIQAFEFSFELAWKTMKRVLGNKGIDVYSPKQTFRAAAQEGLIGDPEIWFGFLTMRNLTVHTYNQLTVEKIYVELPKFISELECFINQLQS